MAKDSKDERHGVTLGFQGGGGLSLRLTTKDADGLRDALAGGEWFDVAGRRRPRADQPLAGRLRAHRDRRAARRLRAGLNG